MLQLDPRLRHLVERLHELGPAPLMHFIDEIEHGAELRPTLERYARLPAEFVRAYRGDELPQRAFAIAGGRRT